MVRSLVFLVALVLPASLLAVEYKDLVDRFEKLEKQEPLSGAGHREWLVERVDVLESMIELAPDHDCLERVVAKLAEGLNRAILNGSENEGLRRLRRISKSFEQSKDDICLAYLEAVRINVEHSLACNAQDFDPKRAEARYEKELKDFVERFPNSPSVALPLLVLARKDEIAGQPERALVKYRRIVQDFPWSGLDEAVGAVKRITSVGKILRLQGVSAANKAVDLVNYRGRVVLLVFWTSLMDESRKQELKEFAAIHQKFAGDDFEMIFISLEDERPRLGEEGQFQFPWPDILETRRNDHTAHARFGIGIYPTVFLVDRSGRLLRQQVGVGGLDEEIGNLLRGTREQATPTK